MTMLLAEYVNIFLILMKKFKLEEKKKLHEIFQGLFVFSFIPIRGIIFPHFVLQVQYSDAPMVFRTLFGLAYFISYIWLHMILNILAKELAKVRVFFN